MENQIENLVLDIKNLSFSYETKEILSNIDLSIFKNETIGLIGHNGAGKSTLMKCITGLELNFKGSIKVCEHDVNKKNLAHIRKHLGYVFQDSDNQLFMPSIYEDIAFAPINYGLDRKEVIKRVDEVLKLVNIEHLKDSAAYKLSGGEKKLASIATILSLNPDLILMDEPSVALDPKNRKNLIKVLNNIKSAKLIASHDLDFIYDTCEKVILINEGKIIKCGNKDEILKDENLLLANSLDLPLRFQK